MEPLNVFEYEALAQERMDPASWDFYAGGSDDEITTRANQADFTRIRLRPRMLVDVTHCDTSTSVLGMPVPMPILVAPTSLHCLAIGQHSQHDLWRQGLRGAQQRQRCRAKLSIQGLQGSNQIGEKARGVVVLRF